MLGHGFELKFSFINLTENTLSYTMYKTLTLLSFYISISYLITFLAILWFKSAQIKVSTNWITIVFLWSMCRLLTENETTFWNWPVIHCLDYVPDAFLLGYIFYVERKFIRIKKPSFTTLLSNLMISSWSRTCTPAGKSGKQPIFADLDSYGLVKLLPPFRPRVFVSRQYKQMNMRLYTLDMEVFDQCS